MQAVREGLRVPYAVYVPMAPDLLAVSVDVAVVCRMSHVFKEHVSFVLYIVCI